MKAGTRSETLNARFQAITHDSLRSSLDVGHLSRMLSNKLRGSRRKHEGESVCCDLRRGVTCACVSHQSQVIWQGTDWERERVYTEEIHLGTVKVLISGTRVSFLKCDTYLVLNIYIAYIWPLNALNLLKALRSMSAFQRMLFDQFKEL